MHYNRYTHVGSGQKTFTRRQCIHLTNQHVQKHLCLKNFILKLNNLKVKKHFTSGRPVLLHFTPWHTCSFTLYPLADLFLYNSPRQTCPFTLYPLADPFLYTLPPGRPVPLHFTPWQTRSCTLYPWQTHSFQHQYRLFWEAFSHIAIKV